MAGLAAANRPRHRIGLSLAVAVTFFILTALPQLRAVAEDVLRVWPVGKEVGKVRNAGPQLLQPHETKDEPALL